MEVWVSYYDFGKKKAVRELRTIDDDFESDNQSKNIDIKVSKEESSVSKKVVEKRWNGGENNADVSEM